MKLIENKDRQGETFTETMGRTDFLKGRAFWISVKQNNQRPRYTYYRID